MHQRRGSPTFTIETSDNTVITKLKKLMIVDPDHFKCFAYGNTVDDKFSSYTFEVDFRALLIRAVPKKRNLTESQKKELAQRFRRITHDVIRFTDTENSTNDMLERADNGGT